VAARIRVRHQDEIRQKIQASQLINRLTDHISGEVELSSSQIKAIEILLKKSVPDLSAVSLEGPNDDGSHTINVIERKIVKA